VQPIFNGSEITIYLESWQRRRDGSKRLLAWSCRTIRDQAGTVTGALSSARDITEQRQVEADLRDSEARLRTAVEEAPFPIILHAEDGDVLQINRAWSEITGYEHADMPTVAAWTEHAFGERKDIVRADIDRLYALDRRQSAGEYVITCKDGSQRVWDFASAPLRQLADGRHLVMSMATDVTDRKKAERELEMLNAELEQRVQTRTAQLQASNQELEAFAYSVSHDLRGPLRAIDGFSRILQEEYSGVLGDEGNRLLNVVRSGTKQMDNLISDLLALSRVTRTGMSMARIDMGQLVSSVYDDLVSHETGNPSTLTLQELPDATGDFTLLRQVWTNLLANALKFTRPRVERKIEVGGYAGKGEIVYSVKDNGVGFNPAYVHKLFGVFQRLHKAEEFEGTGVGLAIVQRIVQRHGGRVWAEGDVDHGATFYFALPASSSEQKEESEDGQS
jgi:PAS domain S-box-containing protein